MNTVIFDIDGVITDGTVIFSQDRTESKRINMKDIDAINEIARRGYFIGAVTAENNRFTEFIREMFPWNAFYDGVTDKSRAIEIIREMTDGKIIYIGDGKKDICALEHADITICPSDAIQELKAQANYILHGHSGSGCLWELLDFLDNEYLVEDEPAGTEWNKILEEHNSLMQIMIMDNEFQKQVILSAAIITKSVLQKKRVVIFGNGGSASEAQHIAGEFISSFQAQRQSLDMEALTVNTSVLTAIGNDYSYDYIFERQVEGMTKPGDVAIGISTSGHSVNVRRALDLAKQKGLKTILLTGNLQEATPYDVTLRVKSNCTARIQEIHLITGHFWAGYAEKVIKHHGHDNTYTQTGATTV